MSKKLRLESTATYVVWQEIEVPDDFDTVDRDAMLELFSMIPCPEAAKPDPRNGRAEISQWAVWEGGRLRFFESTAD